MAVVDESPEALREAVDGSPDRVHGGGGSLSGDCLSDQSMEEGAAGAQDGDVVERDLAADLAADPAEQVSDPFASRGMSNLKAGGSELDDCGGIHGLGKGSGMTTLPRKCRVKLVRQKGSSRPEASPS